MSFATLQQGSGFHSIWLNIQLWKSVSGKYPPLLTLIAPIVYSTSSTILREPHPMLSLPPNCKDGFHCIDSRMIEQLWLHEWNDDFEWIRNEIFGTYVLDSSIAWGESLYDWLPFPPTVTNRIIIGRTPLFSTASAAIAGDFKGYVIFLRAQRHHLTTVEKMCNSFQISTNP